MDSANEKFNTYAHNLCKHLAFLTVIIIFIFISFFEIK